MWVCVCVCVKGVTGWDHLQWRDGGGGRGFPLTRLPLSRLIFLPQTIEMMCPKRGAEGGREGGEGERGERGVSKG